MDRVAREAAADGRPFLAICVGMQLLYDGSEEAPGVTGLGILEGIITRLPSGLVRPHMQWNRLDRCGPEAAMLAGLGAEPWMYFVHSYAAPDSPDAVATSDYGGPVVAAVERGALWATQFHPEKSSTAGLGLLANFVTAARLVTSDR
jgi:glutamine amidotransferase